MMETRRKITFFNRLLTMAIAAAIPLSFTGSLFASDKVLGAQERKREVRKVTTTRVKNPHSKNPATTAIASAAASSEMRKKAQDFDYDLDRYLGVLPRGWPQTGRPDQDIETRLPSSRRSGEPEPSGREPNGESPPADSPGPQTDGPGPQPPITDPMREPPDDFPPDWMDSFPPNGGGGDWGRNPNESGPPGVVVTGTPRGGNGPTGPPSMGVGGGSGSISDSVFVRSVENDITSYFRATLSDTVVNSVSETAKTTTTTTNSNNSTSGPPSQGGGGGGGGS